MITERFKQTLLVHLQIPSDKVEMIEQILTKDKARINADVIEYGDSSQYYSESYVKLIMSEEYQRGKFDGTREPVIHKAEIMSCPVCEYTDKKFTLDDMKKACAIGIDIVNKEGANDFKPFEDLINSLNKKA